MRYLFDPCMGYFTFCADNGGGQKKNNIVIWFIIWIIKTGFFPKLYLLFFVQGYTKNYADRFFNILKGGYHIQAILTPQEMFEVFNYSEQVEIRTTNTSKLIEYNQLLKLFYKALQYGTIKNIFL